MAQALKIPASDFSRSFGKFQDKALEVGVIEVTSHSRVVGAYLSPKELEHFNRLKAKEVQVLHIRDIDDDLWADIERAEYGVKSK